MLYILFLNNIVSNYNAAEGNNCGNEEQNDGGGGGRGDNIIQII
jgi:hypothetical protein